MPRRRQPRRLGGVDSTVVFRTQYKEPVEAVAGNAYQRWLNADPTSRGPSPYGEHGVLSRDDQAVLDDAVAALNTDPENGALRKRLANLLGECAGRAQIVSEWGGWHVVTTTTRAAIRPGCEVEARAWLVGQGVLDLPKNLTERKLARIIDHNGLIAPERLFRTSQRDSIRRS